MEEKAGTVAALALVGSMDGVTSLPERLPEWLLEPLTAWQRLVVEAMFAVDGPVDLREPYRNGRRQYIGDQKWAAAVDPALPDGEAEVNGRRITWNKTGGNRRA